LIKNPAKLVVVGCLILCHRSPKIVYQLGSPGAAGGAYSTPPHCVAGSWGREEKGRDGRRSGMGGDRREGVFPGMKILVVALIAVCVCVINTDVSVTH